MKKHILLGILAVVLTTYSSAQSADDTSGNPELKMTEEGSRLEATVICLDAIEAPTKYNEFAKQFTSLANFPKKGTLSSDELKKNIDQWFKNNPSMIEKVREERKKAHDILYGAHPY